jgi:uncharacterized protein YjbI with pentapeptide repeats
MRRRGGTSAAAIILTSPVKAGSNAFEAAIRKKTSETKKCSKSDLSGADLSGVDVSGVTLTRANMSSATLPGSRLSHATLTGITLTGTDIIRADLTGYITLDCVLLWRPVALTTDDSRTAHRRPTTDLP